MKKLKSANEFIESYFIKQKFGTNLPITAYKDELIILLKKHASQQSKAFYKWMESERYYENISKPGIYHVLSKWPRAFTLRQLYNKFLKTQPK